MQPTARLAPSPTGAFHLGNLHASALTWVAARTNACRLVFRSEDLDRNRVVPGSLASIVADLRWLGLEWDAGPGSEFDQSNRTAYYEQVIAELIERDLAYPCVCSRREVRDVLSAPHASFPETLRYPGTCATIDARARQAALGAPHALRFRACGTFEFVDQIAGLVRADVARNPGDFVIRRRDGFVAYHLAVVADDIAMGVTDVHRGRDLLSAVPAQLALYEAMGAPAPRYWHLPMLVNADGSRLAKRDRSHGRACLEDAGWNAELLRGALAFLWGWLDKPAAVSPSELITLWNPRTLDVGAIVVDESFYDGPDGWDSRRTTMDYDH